MQSKIKAALARRTKEGELQGIINDLHEQITTCETALAALPRMCPEIDENHDAKISLEVARKSLQDLQAIIDNQLRTALIPEEAEESPNSKP